MDSEVWRPVVGYEYGYEVSSLGRVRALRREGLRRGRWGMAMVVFPAKILSLATTQAGYKYVSLRTPDYKRSVKHLIHRLVMRAFVGDAGALVVNHKDGDKSNNSLDNLEYCTHAENLRHCIEVLGMRRGEASGSAKLTEDDVRKIRQDNRSLRNIAGDYGVTLQAIWYVKQRKNWRHVA